MNKQIALNIVKKIVADYKGSGQGSIVLNNFALEVKGEGKFKVESISIKWDFKNVDFSKEQGTLTTSGNSTLELSIKGLSLDHHKGAWSIGDIQINSVDELNNLSLVLPLEDLAAFFQS